MSEEEWDFVSEAPEEDPRRIMWWSPDEDPRPRWLVQREKDQFFPAPEISQRKIYEEGILESSGSGEEGIIKLHKKDAPYAEISSEHKIGVSSVATSHLDGEKPGCTHNLSDVN